MNRLLLTLLFACFGALLYSCAKEYSLETGNGQPPAKGSLYDSSGECMPISTFGTYYNGVIPGPDTCYVEISLTVTQPGYYHIVTDSANGFWFADSGYVTSAGVSTLQLKAFGKPILNVPTDFIIQFDTTVCGFTIYVQDSTGTGLGIPDTIPFAPSKKTNNNLLSFLNNKHRLSSFVVKNFSYNKCMLQFPPYSYHKRKVFV
jgi:hypothetical protein